MHAGIPGPHTVIYVYFIFVDLKKLIVKFCRHFRVFLGVFEIYIGDQLRLILPISVGHSSNLPMRLLCPSILPIGWGHPSTVLYSYLATTVLVHMGAVRLLYS